MCRVIVYTLMCQKTISLSFKMLSSSKFLKTNEIPFYQLQLYKTYSISLTDNTFNLFHLVYYKYCESLELVCKAMRQ